LIEQFFAHIEWNAFSSGRCAGPVPHAHLSGGGVATTRPAFISRSGRSRPAQPVTRDFQTPRTRLRC
jgi:hypothetical protein